MEECVEKVCIWMTDNFPKLNNDKTEVLFLGSPSFDSILSKLQPALLTIGSDQFSLVMLSEISETSWTKPYIWIHK